jgi:hypothetical protein
VSTGGVARYLRWKKHVDTRDYAAASSYLSIRFGEHRAGQVATELRELPVITRRANEARRSKAPRGVRRRPRPGWARNSAC